MEEFQGGVCGGTWWNPPHNLFSGGLSSPCSVAQLGGGGFDMGNFGWQNDVIKGKVNNNNTIFDNLFFSDQLDSSLDILGLSSTTDWNNHQNLMCNNENNEANFGSIIQENMNNNTNHEDASASPSMGMTASSNSSSGDSSTITSCEVVLPIPNTFQINSSASYLIQSLFDDSDDQSQSIHPHHDHQPQFLNNPITSNFGSLDSCNEIISSTNSWVNSLPDHHHNLHHQNSNQYPNIQSSLQSNKLDEGFNSLINNGHAQVLNGKYSPTTLDNIRVSLLNSLQSRSRASFGTKVNSEDQHRRESKNNSSNKDQSPAKRPRIETPSPLPTFKVRKEKLGDRITALQQLVSPFGKTDTASVLHEAIEYIKFLHDQVNVLSTPYLKSGTAIQQQGCEKLKDNEGDNEDLRSKGLCLVPISSTYPMTQETPIDFWTPTFGGTTFR